MFPLGPFELESPFAKGGVCEVWKGRHREQGIPVAVKIGHTERARSAHFAQAFREEVHAVAKLNHPGIIKLFDYGLISKQTELQSHGRLLEGSPYMVMELAEATLIACCGRLGWSGIYRVLMSALDALAHAHARGVVHRDIKPDNILLCGNPSQVKLADFGIAQPVDQDDLPMGRHGLLGTPSYMAPEQFEQRWRDYWPWTDLYALGCTAYALVTGAPPFGLTRDLEQMRQAHLHKEPPPLKTDIPLPPEFQDWLMRLLEKTPARRYRRAADAAWALMQIDELWRESSHPPEPDASAYLPFGLPQPGIYVLHGWDKATEPKAPPTLDLPPPTSLPPAPDQEPSAEYSFHAEEHVDSIELEAMASDSENTWVESFAFGGSPQDQASPTTPHIRQGESSYAEHLPPFPKEWEVAPAPAEDPRLNDAGLGLFGLRVMPMIGRTTEREQLWSVLKQVHDERHAKVVVLNGATGSGKSRLAAWLCERAHEVGISTHVKATHTQTAGATFGLGSMVSRYLRCAGLSKRAVEARLAHSLEAMRPGWGDAREDALLLTEMIAPTTLDPEEEPPSFQFSRSSERYTAIARFLERLCKRRVAIGWLEDVHWGIEALEFAHFFLDRQAEYPSPTLLLLTVQQEAIATREDERILLEELCERAEVEVINLRPLNEEEQCEILNQLLKLSPDLSKSLAARTAGNPMFATLLLKDWIRRDLLEHGEAGFQLREDANIELPDSLHQVWSTHVNELLSTSPPNSRAALELAASLGRDVSIEEWQESCQETGFSLPSGLLEQLLNRHLATHEGHAPSQRWSFVHDMLRESLLRMAQEAGTLDLRHRACAEVLQRRRPPSLPGHPERIKGSTRLVERLAHHLIQSKRPKEALSPMLQGIWGRFDAGEYRRGWQLLIEWQKLLHQLSIPPEHPYWGEVWLLHCQYSHSQGRNKSALMWAKKAEQQARHYGWNALLIRALMQLGYDSWLYAKDSELAWQYLEEAHDRAIVQGDRWATTRSQHYIGNLLCSQGKLGPAARAFQDAFDGFELLADHTGMGHALYGLAQVARQARQFDRALSHLHTAQKLYEASGCRRGIADALNIKGDILRLKGDFATARQSYHKAMEIYRSLGDSNTTLSQLNFGQLALEQGNFQEAAQRFQHAHERFSKDGQTQLQGTAALGLLACAAHAKAWDQWDALIPQVETLFQNPHFHNVDAAKTAQYAGNLALKAGSRTRARHAYTLALQQWQSLGQKREIDELIQALKQLPS